ncbi:hypothetical protein [Paracoccus saliphilus]|nr:hypothetical protein [Paracoccus saliphilus]
MSLNANMSGTGAVTIAQMARGRDELNIICVALIAAFGELFSGFALWLEF